MPASKKILVSGGAGFVGRHLIDHLLNDDPSAEIWVVDDLSTGQLPTQWELYRVAEVAPGNGVRRFEWEGQAGRGFNFIQANFIAVLAGELGYAPRLDLPELPVFDEAYHLASIVGGRAVIEGQPLLVGVDLAIDSLFFLWAAKLGKVKRILYASSSAAYPVNLQRDEDAIRLDESMIDFDNGVLAPDLTYGWSKLTGEYLARIAVQKHGIPVGVVRPFSGYGEDQDPTYPVPAIALRVAARQNPVRVWGSGLQGRDFVHIDDCARGLIMTCRQVSDASAVNLSSGVLTSFLDVAKLMVRLEGFDAPVTGTDNRPVGVAKRYGGCEQSERLIGWRASIGIEEGMLRVVRHARWRLANGYEPKL